MQLHIKTIVLEPFSLSDTAEIYTYFVWSTFEKPVCVKNADSDDT